MKTLAEVSFTTIEKRDGSKVPFSKDRIVRAIALAQFEVLYPNTSNDARNDPHRRYGLDSESYARCVEIADQVITAAVNNFGRSAIPKVEEVQDLIEQCLLDAGAFQVVRAFIAYRTAHATLRPVTHKENGLQDYIAVSRYCRFSPKLGRREIWPEAVERVRDMHLARFSNKMATQEEVAKIIEDLKQKGIVSESAIRDAGGVGGLFEEIHHAFDMVKAKRVLPSMRSLQFGGIAIEDKNARMFNCAFTPANRIEFFREFFYLLLCGCGVGFSVQKHHVAMLPPIAPRKDEIELKVVHHIIPDTIEGWAEAAEALMDSYYKGYKIEFSYHLIRPHGAPLKKSGGKAPGHLPLKRALDQCAKVLDRAAGRHLRPIEVYDIAMFIAKAVLSGGVRRSATICLFSADDDEMMAAKSGDYYSENPQRSASNNSAVLIRGEVTRAQFDKLFECQKTYGEPGFYFSESKEIGCNPCVEIGLNPQLVVTEQVRDQLIRYGYDKPVNIGDTLYGVQMCNLTTMAGKTASSPEEFFKQAKYASLIGTLQADYTDMPFLGPVTRVLNEREALIGVSICGVLDNSKVLLNPEILRRGAEVVKAVNAVVAAVIGIRRAARTTCVKPEGTSSLLMDCGSGISPHHSRRYFRRVQANIADPVYKLFKSVNPHMVEKSVYDQNNSTDVITFTVEGPEHGIYRDDITAIQHLEYVRLVQENWVIPGRAYNNYSECHHNVSNTINVDKDEWEPVADFIWDNRHMFTGVALLESTGDKVHPQSPRETVATAEDIRRWNNLAYNPVDYRQIAGEDETAGAEHRAVATACSGGACELV